MASQLTSGGSTLKSRSRAKTVKRALNQLLKRF
jgi:hypothetical protein